MERPTPVPLLRRIRPRHWRVLDGALAFAYGLGAAALFANHARSALAVAAALVGAAAVALPIAQRRSHPIAAFLVVLATSGVLIAVQPRTAAAALTALVLVLYTLAVSASLRVSVLALAGALAAAWATALPDFKSLGGAATFSLAYLAVWTVGNARNLHGRYTSDLLNGHIAEERVRIARELHDVLAHQMTVITVQAGYAGLLLDEGIDVATGQRARSALGVIESAGRETLEEMRHLVGVLRPVPGPNEDADAGGLAPTPGLADLPRLVERAAHAGVRVEVAVRGAGRALRAGEDLAAYRIVQEAITNVIRHSGGTTARVTLTYADGELFIEICDDGSGNTRSARANPLGVGRGLAGMRERVRLYGGQLEAGPAAAGGFKVAARLPLAAAANGDT